MRRFLVLLIILIPTFALAQDVPPGEVGGVLGDVLKFILGATGITLLSQILLSAGLSNVIPAPLKPLIGPAFGVLASLLSGLVGFVPDFNPIVGVLLGTAAANIFDLAKGVKWLNSTG